MCSHVGTVKRTLFLLAGLIISVVSLFFAFQGFDLGGVWGAMQSVQPVWFALMVLPFILTFMSKVWRWRVMFHPDEPRVSNNLLFSALMISYIPLPFRAGEVARGFVVSSRSGVPAPRVFSTILVEKVLDVLTLLLLLGISLPFVKLPGDMQRPAITLAVGVTVGTLLMLGLVLRPQLARGLARIVARRLPMHLGPRIEVATEQVLQGFAPMLNPAVALRVALWSLVTWSINVVTIYCLLRAFNIEVGPLVASVLVVATNLSMAVPAAPGSLGTFELAVVGILTALGLPTEVAQTFSILDHFIGLVPVALMGVIAAVVLGVGAAAFHTTAPRNPPPPPSGTVATLPTPRDKR